VFLIRFKNNVHRKKPTYFLLFSTQSINVRENRRGSQEWTIQRNWQHWAHKTQDEDKQNTKSTTQYVLDTLCANEHK